MSEKAVSPHRTMSVVVILLAVIMVCVAGYVVVGTLRTTRWVPAQRYLVEEETFYGTLHGFRDRGKVADAHGPPPEPLLRDVRPAGQPSLGDSIDVFDHATYFLVFRLADGVAHKLRLESHSTGRTSITPVLDSLVWIDRHSYELSTKVVEYDLMASRAGTAAVIHHYYNGFQRSKNGWESDGGVHIYYPTRRLDFAFDLGAVVAAGHIVEAPKCYRIDAKGKKRLIPVDPPWERGIVRFREHNLAVGETVIVDWKWVEETE